MANGKAVPVEKAEGLAKLLEYIAQRISSSYYNVNRGGCCVVAAAVAEKLTALKIPHKIRVSDNETRVPIGTIRKRVTKNTLQEWNSNGLHFGHVFVEMNIGGDLYHFDTDEGLSQAGRCDPSCGFPVLRGSLTLKEAKDLAACSQGWNRAFNRSQIPGIKRAITMGFKKLK